MIYEMRTYTLRPQSLPEVERRFGEAYEKRKKLSPMSAFWHTEIGPLNQIVHVWPYKDLEERTRIRAAAVEDGSWPPKIGEFVLDMQSDIMIPLDISPEIQPGKMGPFFEMRTYSYIAGELPNIRNAYARALPDRLRYSPVCALWYSEIGALNRFVHIWPYPSLDARTDIRAKTQAAGIWPPSVVAKREGLPEARLLVMENKILMPSSFSPLQ